jgi:FMN phosphatase YigB (HAD superfamily)
MRIAIDIDSTLHHYWDVLSDAALRRFGIELPYEEQFDWGITRLRPEQLQVCIEETHSDEVIEAAEPYPDAVETVRRWHEEGHFVHITSHRSVDAHPATERWLRRIGLPFDELYCSSDKVTRCRDIDIDVLIDDSPVNLLRAIEAGITPATILHPWNADVCEEERVVSARSWPELAAKLDPVLGADGA